MTVWLVYALFATTNVARETYLALAVAEHGSIRVDEYEGLHPDIFAIPGRGAFINNNPGASLLGAIPLLAARPLLAALFAVRPDLTAPKPPAAYQDPRPNRTRFLNRARERGLDVKLGLAALITQAGMMAPLGALAVLLLYGFLRGRGHSDRSAVLLAVLYAFGTPLLFRSGFLNQNAILAHCTLIALLLVIGPRARPAAPGGAPAWTVAGAGAALGVGLLCDYSAAPLLLVFGLWCGAERARAGWRAAVAACATFALGAALPIGLLLWYQYAAFGSPWFPAQRYMPPTELSTRGWNGFFVPTRELLIGNLFDPRYGLFAFSPILLAALGAPFVQRDSGEPRAHLFWLFAGTIALYLFSSANQYANLQWNTGVRYMVPATPLLFLALVPVLRRLNRTGLAVLVSATLLVSLAVSMMRESVTESLRLLFLNGPTLPVFIALQKMATAYPGLQVGVLGPLVALGVGAALLVLVWRGVAWEAPAAATSHR